MKTIITKEIDGIEIVKGFSRLAKDPVATQNVAADKLKDDPLIKQKDELFDRKKELAQELANMTKDYIKKPTPTKENQIKQQKTKLAMLATEFNELSGHIARRFKELKKENQQYFEPSRNEKAVSDETFEDLQSKAKDLLPRHALKPNGDIIHDFRGIKFYIKDGDDWNKGIIKKLNQGLPEGAKTEKELTTDERMEIAEQADIERIYKMSSAQRENELKGKLNLLMLNTNARIELEADGDEQKKQQIKDEYKNEKARLESRYNV